MFRSIIEQNTLQFLFVNANTIYHREVLENFYSLFVNVRTTTLGQNDEFQIND